MVDVIQFSMSKYPTRLTVDLIVISLVWFFCNLRKMDDPSLDLYLLTPGEAPGVEWAKFDSGCVQLPEDMRTKRRTRPPTFPPHAPEQVVDIVQKSLAQGGGSEAAEACAEVIAASAERWRQFEGAYRDDISCIVLRLSCFEGLVATPENLLEHVDETGEIIGAKTSESGRV